MSENYASNIIKRKRKELGLSQDDVAKYLGLTRVSVINIESGKHGLKYDTIYELCCLLNLQPSELFIRVRPVKIQFKEVKEVKTITKKIAKIIKQPC